MKKSLSKNEAFLQRLTSLFTEFGVSIHEGGSRFKFDIDPEYYFELDGMVHFDQSCIKVLQDAAQKSLPQSQSTT